MYNEQMVLPMRQDLVDKGVEELKSREDVDGFMLQLKEKKDSRAVIFINSVCGCAAGVARPAFVESLQDLSKEVLVATAFAGVDKVATENVRQYFTGVAPSSPSIGFFRGGSMVYFVDRLTIEGSDAECLKQYLMMIYKKFLGVSIDENVQLCSPQEMLEISVEEVSELLKNNKANVTFYDCRDVHQHKAGSLPHSECMTNELAEQLVSQVDLLKDTTMIFFSNHGESSLKTVSFFRKQGLGRCFSLRGGYEEWKKTL